MSAQVFSSNENNVENHVPIHTTAKVEGTKIAVRSHSGVEQLLRYPHHNGQKQIEYARRGDRSTGVEIDLHTLDLVNRGNKAGCGNVGESADQINQGDPDKRHHRSPGN
jgi:hypothetical protein